MNSVVIPTVSVLMTAYNREKYIAEAIESVIASTYQDWELIIVDDCSTDKTVEIARAYESKDARIKVYVNEKNLGQFPNRNKAAALATGKYLKYLDSDDIIYPHGLEVMVEAMEKFPDAGFALQDIKTQENIPYPVFWNKSYALREHFFKKPFLLSGPSGVIFRKEAFEKVNGFNDNNYVGSDTEILLKLVLIYDIVIFQPALIWWREHDEQEFRRGVDSNEYILHEDEILKSILTDSLCPLSEKEKKIIFRRNRNLQIKRFIRLVSEFKLCIAAKLLKKIINIKAKIVLLQVV